jgi:hypothetical protein
MTVARLEVKTLPSRNRSGTGRPYECIIVFASAAFASSDTFSSSQANRPYAAAA